MSSSPPNELFPVAAAAQHGYDASAAAEDYLDCLDGDELLGLFGGSKLLTDEELEALADSPQPQPQDAPQVQASAQPQAQETVERQVEQEPTEEEKEDAAHEAASTTTEAILEEALQVVEATEQQQSYGAHKRRGNDDQDDEENDDIDSDAEERPKKRRSLGNLQNDLATMAIAGIDDDGNASSDDDDDEEDDEEEQERRQQEVAEKRREQRQRKQQAACKKNPSTSTAARRSQQRGQQSSPSPPPPEPQQIDFAAQYQQMMDSLARSMQRSEESRCRLDELDAGSGEVSEVRARARRQMQEQHRRMSLGQPSQQRRVSAPRECHRQQSSCPPQFSNGGAFQTQHQHFLGRLACTMKMSEQSRSFIDRQQEQFGGFNGGHSQQAVRRSSGVFPIGRLM